jgi:hypothetical protein
MMITCIKKRIANKKYAVILKRKEKEKRRMTCAERRLQRKRRATEGRRKEKKIK